MSGDNHIHFVWLHTLHINSSLKTIQPSNASFTYGTCDAFARKLDRLHELCS